GEMGVRVAGDTRDPSRRRAGTHLRGCEPVYARTVNVTVTIADSVTDELIDAFARLIPQLSSSSPPPTADDLAAIIAADSTDLLVARDVDGTILGSLTLVLFRIPTGVKAWIEDVVVDERARGRGVGEALNQHALALAAEGGARSEEHTSE